MRYIYVATLLFALNSHAQPVQMGGGGHTQAPEPIGRVGKGVFNIETPNQLQVVMPAAAAQSLIKSQSNLINELMNKVTELEGRIEKLEKGGKR